MELFFESTDEGLRVRAPWRLLLQWAIFVAILQVALGFLVAGWLFFGSGKVPATGDVVKGPAAAFLISSLASLVAAVLSVWAAGRFLDRRPFAGFGFHISGGWFMDLAFGLGLGALLMTGVFLTELGMGWTSIEGTFQSLEPGSLFLVGLMVPIVGFLCTGLTEELVSRGYRLRNLAEGFNFPLIGPRRAILLAWVLSSLYFGLRHAPNPDATVVSTINIMVAGLMLGTGYILTGELAIPIGLHITWNFFEGNVFGFPVSGIGPFGATFVATEQGGPTLWTGGGFGPEAGLLGVIAALLGCFLIALWVRFRRGKVSILASIAEPPKPLLPNGSAPEQTSG